MKSKAFFATVLLLLSAGQALAACGTIRFAYPDQHRPPYWLGNGQAVPEPAGASVEWVREFAASGNCGLSLVRLPTLRLRPSLASGAVDFTPVDITGDGQPGIMLPRDANGKPDTRRATTLVVVAFVRVKDGIARSTDPFELVRGRRVGIMYGSTYAPALQQAGAILDQGGPTVPSNFDKLELGRIDAFIVPLIAEHDMDRLVATRYNGAFVRLDKPILKSHIWLATNPKFYNANRELVESMWNWLGDEGNKRFNLLLRKYTEH